MQTVTFNGGNLFQIAADYLGDATQWVRIAQQNGNIVDPFFTGTRTLIIPDPNPDLTGGIVSQ
jgi:hypothetical protein